mgnify:CR=1 FL=1
MAKNEKKSLETRKHEANLKLEKLGVLDTVNAFLATQEAKAEVGAVFDNYLNGLKEFAAKMPDVAKEVTSKILEDIEILGNLANKNQYEYTDEQVEKIFGAIEKELADTKESFKKKKPVNKFSL